MLRTKAALTQTVQLIKIDIDVVNIQTKISKYGNFI